MTVTEILALITQYHQASTRRLHLIPSENPMSLAARLPYLTDVIHRYCFTAEGENWAWPGKYELSAIESAAKEDLRLLFGAKHVNIKPISGINCMAIVLSALAERGGTVFNIGEADGGHGSTRFIAKRLGLNIVDLPYERSSFTIDTDRLARIAEEALGPKLVYLDQFMCLFPHNLVAIRAAVGPETVIHYDGSHVMGLIAGGQFQKPLAEGADSLAGSTHKSFPGPHKGVILTNSDQISTKINEHASHWVSHHHPADVAALAITLASFHGDAASYAAQTVGNARRLGHALAGVGFTVCAAERGFTRSHQLWIDIAPIMDPLEANQRLMAAGIVANAIDIPYLASKTGLRLGVQEVTRLGMGSDDMMAIASIMERLLIKREEASAVSADVQSLCARHFSHDQEVTEAAIRLICQSVTARESH